LAIGGWQLAKGSRQLSAIGFQLKPVRLIAES
jgi:hypothetical protein